ncbi:MAG: tyrosine phosphatase family protein [Parvibaculaceae bacterium]
MGRIRSVLQNQQGPEDQMIYICPLDTAAVAISNHQPSHLVSLLDQQRMIDTPEGINPRHHLKLSINDIAAPDGDLVAPAPQHISRLIEFVKEWDQKQPMLIHCWIGISRSTAAAFIALCALNEGRSEGDLAHLLRDLAPHASPNPLMVRLADDILGRQGRMSAAIENLAAASTVFGKLVAIPTKLPLRS